MSGIARQHHISYHNYADDTQLYISCDNNAESIREAISLIERCIILDICKWTGNNSLKINEDKTEFVIFSRNPEKYINLSLTVGTNTINISESVKLLGVTLDNKLNMQKDIANTCRASYMHIGKIKSIRRYLNEQTTETLVNATVFSRLDYCNGVYTGLPQKSLHKLQLALHAAARLITGTPIHDLYCNN